MGFYGNITNTSRTQFQFDKIYPSRAEMDAGTYTDGIYAGRYVLVEYDSNVHQSSFYQVWIKDSDEDKGMYVSPNFEEETAIWINSKPNERKGTVLLTGAIVFTAKVDKENNKYTDTVYYQITGSSGLLIKERYKQVTSDKTLLPDGTESTVANYIKNYAIDNEKYGAGRGYDSTVWQKAYIDNVEKYIMIAELNSVVPTFDVSADAPSVEPITPHFDTQSTDLYYKLHWQPTWGMRIAEGKLPDAEESGGITSSKDPNSGEYPSDENVSYSKLKYNPATKEVEEDKQQPEVRYKGAIYYNKAGFKDYKHTYYNGDFKEDKISVQPLGISGMLYNQHGNSIELTAQPDIQEISIMLPSLGNALCDIWDKVYGYEDDPESGEDYEQRYRDIEWKDAKNPENNLSEEVLSSKIKPQGKKALGYMTRKPETLAGCINMTHDLMGMIITKEPAVLNDDEYQKHYIYYHDNKYWRIYKYPKYQTIPISWKEPTGVPDQERNSLYRKAVQDALTAAEASGEEVFYVVEDKGDDDEWIVQRYNKNVLGDPKKVLAIKTNTFGYKEIEIKSFADNFNTINGLIVSLRNLIESDNSETRNRKTVQGTINTLNDIIDQFNALTPGEFLICNDQGKVSSANWTTEQTFGYDNLGKNSSEKEASGKENQWIELSVDESASDKQIKVIHKLVEEDDHKQDDTVTESDKNNASFNTAQISSKTLEDGQEFSFNGINNNNNINTLKLYTPIVDNAGHVVGKNTETVTLPYGYKYLKTNGITDKEDSDLYTIFDEETRAEIKPDVITTEVDAKANSTQDQITINTGNKWIQTRIEDASNNDIITIAHEIHKIDKTEQETNNNGEVDENNKPKISSDSKNNIVAYDVEVDAAGHVIKNQKHTYTLPYGFKTIKTNGRATNNNVEEITNQNDVVADNTQDDLTINSGNEWIKITTNSGTDTITISHDARKTSDNGKNDDVSLSKEDDSASFLMPVDTYDGTNHYSGRVTTKYILPNNYGKIKADNTTTNPEGPISEASSSHDTLSLTGDDWIGTSVSKDVVSFNHKVPQENGLTTTIDSITKTPALGGSFSVPKVSYDKNGHIYNDTSYDITLPSLELSGTKENTDNNVMTNFTYTKNGTVMTATFGKIGDLALTGYSTPTSITKDISDLDNLNTGLGKLRYYINKEVIDRENAIKGLTIENGTSSSSEARPSLSVANTITSLSYANSTTTYTVAPIQIEQSQVIGLQNTLEALLNKITVLENKVSELESKQNS